MSSKYFYQLEREIKQQLQQLSRVDIRYEYNIVVNDDKSVYDELNQRHYKNIDEWLGDYLDDSKEDIDYMGSYKGYRDQFPGFE